MSDSITFYFNLKPAYIHCYISCPYRLLYLLTELLDLPITIIKTSQNTWLVLDIVFLVLMFFPLCFGPSDQGCLAIKTKCLLPSNYGQWVQHTIWWLYGSGLTYKNMTKQEKQKAACPRQIPWVLTWLYRSPENNLTAMILSFRFYLFWIYFL